MTFYDLQLAYADNTSLRRDRVARRDLSLPIYPMLEGQKILGTICNSSSSRARKLSQWSFGVVVSGDSSVIQQHRGTPSS